MKYIFLFTVIVAIVFISGCTVPDRFLSNTTSTPSPTESPSLSSTTPQTKTLIAPVSPIQVPTQTMPINLDVPTQPPVSPPIQTLYPIISVELATPSPTPVIVSNTPTPSTTAQVDECNSNSDCGYKQICSGGSCIDVQCTTDSQCSGCKRCSGNSCVSCGKGPYGCYC